MDKNKLWMKCLSIILVSIMTLTFATFAFAQTDIKLPHEKKIGRGILIISSKPAGAKVFLNGKFGGNTPISMPDLIPGTYEVKVTKINHGAVTKKVFMEEYKNIEVSLTLKSRTKPIGISIALVLLSIAGVYAERNM